jgi:hypothetical protein
MMLPKQVVLTLMLSILCIAIAALCLNLSLDLKDETKAKKLLKILGIIGFIALEIGVLIEFLILVNRIADHTTGDYSFWSRIYWLAGAAAIVIPICWSIRILGDAMKEENENDE